MPQGALQRASMTWSALNGQTLISLPLSIPHQQLIDKHLRKTGVAWERGVVVNFLDTQKVKTCNGSPDSPAARSAGPQPEALRSEPG
jgi:hypothetical protein